MTDYIEREKVYYQLAKQATIDGQPRAIKRAAKIVADFPVADVVEKKTVRKAFAEACQECRDACEEFDGFYADCNQCLLHGVKEKLKDVLEEAET